MRYMEVPRLGVELELQLLAYTIATLDLSQVCDLYHISWQCQVLNPLSGGRDRTHIFMDTSWIHFAEPQWELPLLFSYCGEILPYIHGFFHCRKIPGKGSLFQAKTGSGLSLVSVAYVLKYQMQTQKCSWHFNQASLLIYITFLFLQAFKFVIFEK